MRRGARPPRRRVEVRVSDDDVAHVLGAEATLLERPEELRLGVGGRRLDERALLAGYAEVRAGEAGGRFTVDGRAGV